MQILMIGISVILMAVLAVTVLLRYMNHQMSKLSKMSFDDTLSYALRGKRNAVITIGVIQNGQATYTVYGENGTVLPNEEHVYEIGSLTKTFTSALVEKAIAEGKLHLDDTVDKHIKLPEGNCYPTIRQLLTHTSGYKGAYFEAPMVANFFHGRNDFFRVGVDMLIKRLSRLSVSGGPRRFAYSNFGYAVLGSILEAVYGEDYETLVNRFSKNDLGLLNTHISDKSGDFGQYWDWADGDAYLSAGGLTSTITDMLAYARMQLSDDGIFGACHKSLAVINLPHNTYAKMGIYLDEIGMGWIIDNHNGTIWHNGGTGDYNCHLGVNLKNNTAVVALSNLSPSNGVPATVLAIKLLKALER